MVKIEIKYNSVKQGKEEELQSVFLAIGTQRLEKSKVLPYFFYFIKVLPPLSFIVENFPL